MCFSHCDHARVVFLESKVDWGRFAFLKSFDSPESWPSSPPRLHTPARVFTCDPCSPQNPELRCHSWFNALLVTDVNFLITFEQGNPQFHFALGAANDVVDAAQIHHILSLQIPSIPLPSGSSSLLFSQGQNRPLAGLVMTFRQSTICREPMGSHSQHVVAVWHP